MVIYAKKKHEISQPGFLRKKTFNFRENSQNKMQKQGEILQKSSFSKIGDILGTIEYDAEYEEYEVEIFMKMKYNFFLNQMNSKIYHNVLIGVWN